MKKLSIITINYNNAEGLKKTIQSVVEQTGFEAEYIVIDGGSTDESLAVIGQFKDRISYWVSEKDNGVYAAMNKGIRQASGEYCLFLNSGDYLWNNKVLSLVFAQEQTADLVYGNMQIDLGNGRLQTGRMPARMTFEHMYRDTLWHPVSFIKRELFEKYGLYKESYKMVADYEFFFHVIVMKTVSMHYMNLIISVYNIKGLSSLPENKQMEKEERRRVHQTYLPPLVIELAERCLPAYPAADGSLFTKIKRIFK
jgi:glycosyltransferase involved in cell wall biosynthesis